MSKKPCGICFSHFINLKQHLSVLHKVPNKDELKLLMKYGNGRSRVNLDCDICGKKELVRLDKHLLDRHGIILAEVREPIIKQAKRAAVVKELAALRESNPGVAMVSMLDMDIKKEDGDLPSGELSENPVPEEQMEEKKEEPEEEDFLLQDVEMRDESTSDGQSHTGIKPPDKRSTPIRQRISTDDSPQLTATSVTPQACESGLTTGLGAKGCPCNWEQFASRLEQLERKVDGLINAQQQTPKTIPSAPPLSAQKGERVSKEKTGTNLFEKIVEDYSKFRLGPRSGRKDRENARQSSSHALRFCLYMSAGLPSRMVCHDLRFLNQMDKLRAWTTYLSQKGYAPTSIKNILNNVIMFIKHVENSFQSASKLKQKDLKKINYEIKRIQSEVQRNVVVHRQKVLRHKTAEQLHASQEARFLMVARKNIPKLFKCLARSGDDENNHSKVMGYVMGYLSVLTGHRSVVLTNMTKENVNNVETWNHGQRFQVLVDDHKTVRSFGQAAFNLNKEEFGWLKNLSKGKCCLQGRGCKFVFHTTLGKQILKPMYVLHLAWTDSGMQGTVNFNKIRSSLST